MELADRVLNYRARHKLSRKQMDELLGMGQKTTLVIETGCRKMQLCRTRQAELRMNELEEEERNVL